MPEQSTPARPALRKECFESAPHAEHGFRKGIGSRSGLNKPGRHTTDPLAVVGQLSFRLFVWILPKIAPASEPSLSTDCKLCDHRRVAAVRPACRGVGASRPAAL